MANGTMAGISCDGFFQEVSAEVAVMLYQRVEKNRRRIRKAAGRVCADRVLLAAWRPAPAAAVAEHGWVEFDLARFSLVRAENRPAAGSCVPAPWPVESN